MALDTAISEHLVSDVPSDDGGIGCTQAAALNFTDLHGLSICAPTVLAMYTMATELFRGLLNRRLEKEDVIQRLRKLGPRLPFKYGYVASQAVKFINPRGHGANSARFNNETLSWFRQAHPQDAHLTSGMCLIICAAKWWASEQGQRSIQPRVSPLTTADLDEKLKSFGFLDGERQAILRLLRPANRTSKR